MQFSLVPQLGLSARGMIKLKTSILQNHLRTSHSLYMQKFAKET
eukprot:COSAG01_NODE_65106_length_274_cov_0.685714_1_plen_43_part_10